MKEAGSRTGCRGNASIGNAAAIPVDGGRHPYETRHTRGAHSGMDYYDKVPSISKASPLSCVPREPSGATIRYDSTSSSLVRYCPCALFLISLPLLKPRVNGKKLFRIIGRLAIIDAMATFFSYGGYATHAAAARSTSSKILLIVDIGSFCVSTLCVMYSQQSQIEQQQFSFKKWTEGRPD